MKGAVRRRLRTACTGLVALATALTAAACSSSAKSPTTAEQPFAMTIWLMQDSVSYDFLTRFRTEFTKEHPNIALSIQTQPWDGIGDKITNALAGDTPPDVIEVGNTQVARYAAQGNMTDLTSRIGELGGEDWIPGLAEPGRINGRQYGIPWYAANRVVIYNKELFEAAGVKDVPKTRSQWLADTEKLNTGSTQGIYLPGQYWYVLAGFIWDEGGDLAVRSAGGSDGKESQGSWKGALDTPKALAGMDFFQRLQALGKGPKSGDEATPQQGGLFAEGRIAQIIDTPAAADLLLKQHPEMRDKVGYFPVPGKTADKPGAVFTGGSDLIIPRASTHPAAALQVVKELTGKRWQVELSQDMSYVPNKTSLAGAAAEKPSVAAMAAGAANGHATPNSPDWANVEGDNPIKRYMTQVLLGQNRKAAAKAASRAITKELDTSPGSG